MSWLGLEGHDDVVEQFRTALRRGRLASTFLFVGPEGVGKSAFAVKLAQTLLCQTNSPGDLNPCQVCGSCRQVLAGTHPDLLRVAKPADKSSLPLGLLIGDGDKRMREGLCHDIALRAQYGGRKIAIIDDADYLNQEGANCLLKTLEEPPPGAVLVLIGTSPDRQLPTIRSRAQTIRFRPLPAEVVAKLLLAEGIVADQTEATRLASYGGGSPARARELADPALWSFRRELLGRLAARPLESVELGRELSKFVDEAGKEAPPRRARMRQLLAFTLEFFRQVVRALHSLPTVADAELARLVEKALAAGWSLAGAAAAIERATEALGHIERNVHQATLLESWTEDLGRAAMNDCPAI